jgi:hypothetical protein
MAYFCVRRSDVQLADRPNQFHGAQPKPLKSSRHHAHTPIADARVSVAVMVERAAGALTGNVRRVRQSTSRRCSTAKSRRDETDPRKHMHAPVLSPVHTPVLSRVHAPDFGGGSIQRSRRIRFVRTRFTRLRLLPRPRTRRHPSGAAFSPLRQCSSRPFRSVRVREVLARPEPVAPPRAVAR